MRLKLALMLVTLCSTPLRAGLILNITDGSSSVTIVDNAPAGTPSSPSGSFTSTLDDMNVSAGAISFTGSIGDFSVELSALSKPEIGPAIVALESVSVTGGPGSLVIYVADTDFFPPIGRRSSVFSTFSGVTEWRASFGSGWDAANSEGSFNSRVALSFGPGAFSETSSSVESIPMGSPFTLGQRVTITHTAGDAHTVLDLRTFVDVPEPTTLFLFGTGLVGLMGYGRRRGE